MTGMICMMTCTRGATMKRKKQWNPIICVDFDGVIHSYTSGWAGIDKIIDSPVEGAIGWLTAHLPTPKAFKLPNIVYTGPIVQIYSSRSRSRKGRRAMKTWLLFHGLDRAYIKERILKFPRKKPPAFLTVDDRAWCFVGTFPTTKEMVDFTPWYKK